MKPRLFIGSSMESRDIALAIQSTLARDIEATVWDQDVFTPSSYGLEALETILGENDFGVFVFAADDRLKLRDDTLDAPRDNVVLEMGLSLGRLGRKRTFLFLPRGAEIRIPSDLLGFTAIEYETDRQDKNLARAVAPMANRLRDEIFKVHRQDSKALKRFVEAEEPSLLDDRVPRRIGLPRAYKLLLHMFRREQFDEFRAFDLAFGRWEELLSDVGEQTINISYEIFEAMERVFVRGCCTKFHRILVLSETQLSQPAAQRVLRKIHDQEEAWRARFSGLPVETRVLPYPSPRATVARDRIRRLHDVAVFSGADEALAIVETTLTAPTDRVENPECEVVVDEDRIDHMVDGFDEFWPQSRSLAEVLGAFRLDVAVKDPVQDALARIERVKNKLGPHTAFIIEAGYFDLRHPDDADRFKHLEDSLGLLQGVRKLFPNLDGRIFPEVFVNDFSTANVCGFNACDDQLRDLDTPDGVIWRGVLEELEDRYRKHALHLEEGHVFSMRRTRNQVTSTIKRFLKQRKPVLYEGGFGDLTVDLYVATCDGLRINLGYRDIDSTRITPRCTAIMAHHYFELFQAARRKLGRLDHLWIFDFNRMTEADAVEMGAKAAFALYSWPEDLQVKILNVVYGEAEGHTRIQEVSGP